MRFGEYIQKLREAKALTLSEAARELCITPQRLCDIEQGRRNFTSQPPLILMRRLAALYDHPFASLVTNTEFFQYEKDIITDLLADLEPLANQLETKVLEMFLEAKQYTPEMESHAAVAHKLTQELKMGILLAKTRYSRAIRTRILDAPRSKRTGKAG